jgi:anaerobic selenocysteine-containing dehydrogenase
VEPLGEAKSDETIALDLVRRLNPENVPWKDEKEFTDYCMANLQSAEFDGNYDDLVRKVDDWIPFEYQKYEKGLLRPDGELGFNTPTGRIELWVTQLEQFDYPALPYYLEPTESPVSTPELMKEYPFVLTTGQRCYEFFHSEHRQLKSMREFHPDPIMEINPEDAAPLGIKDGDWVWLENKHGKCKQRARLHPGMLKGVVNAEHGWWFPEKEAAEPSLYGAFESNINCLTTQFDYGPTTFGAPYKTQMCKVYKA